MNTLKKDRRYLPLQNRWDSAPAVSPKETLGRSGRIWPLFTFIGTFSKEREPRSEGARAV